MVALFRMHIRMCTMAIRPMDGDTASIICMVYQQLLCTPRHHGLGSGTHLGGQPWITARRLEVMHVQFDPRGVTRSFLRHIHIRRSPASRHTPVPVRRSVHPPFGCRRRWIGHDSAPARRIRHSTTVIRRRRGGFTYLCAMPLRRRSIDLRFQHLQRRKGCAPRLILPVIRLKIHRTNRSSDRERARRLVPCHQRAMLRMDRRR